VSTASGSGTGISVVEVWHLKPELADRAEALMQEMDDLLEDNAHGHPGWCGHARFFASTEEPGRVLVLYPWRSAEPLADLVRGEEPLLADFVARCCTRPREVHVYEELAVDVEPETADHG